MLFKYALWFWHRICSTCGNVLCVLEKNVGSVLIGWHLGQVDNVVQFFCALTFYVLVLPITDRLVLRSPTIIVKLPTSFNYVNFWFMYSYFEALVQHVYTIVISKSPW